MERCGAIGAPRERGGASGAPLARCGFLDLSGVRGFLDLCEWTLVFRSPDQISSLLNLLLHTGFHRPEDLAAISQSQLCTRLQAHNSFTYTLLADAITLRTVVRRERSSAWRRQRSGSCCPPGRGGDRGWRQRGNRRGQGQHSGTIGQRSGDGAAAGDDASTAPVVADAVVPAPGSYESAFLCTRSRSRDNVCGGRSGRGPSHRGRTGQRNGHSLAANDEVSAAPDAGTIVPGAGSLVRPPGSFLAAFLRTRSRSREDLET